MRHFTTLLLAIITIQSAHTQEIQITHSNANYFVDTKTFELRDGLPDGHYTVFFDSLKTKVDYDGQIEGSKRNNRWTWYFDTGLKRREISYTNGLFNGEVISYYPNGQKSASMIYTTGIQNGTITRWHTNGNVRLEGKYTDGNPSGIWKYFDEGGQIIKEEQH